jgi:nuclear pore complex protein Nup98-Nup96
LEAEDQKAACDIVIADLAPDAIIRHDLAVLRELFEPFTSDLVDDWTIRGKVSF